MPTSRAESWRRTNHEKGTMDLHAVPDECNSNDRTLDETTSLLHPDTPPLQSHHPQEFTSPSSTADFGIGLCDEEIYAPVHFASTQHPHSKSDGGIHLLRRTEDSLASMGSLLAHYAFHRNRYERPPSLRSQGRYRLNVILGLSLLVTIIVLLVMVACVALVTVVRPAIRRHALETAIRNQAQRDAQLTEQCQGIAWQDACAATLTHGAGARRLKRKKSHVFDENSDDATDDISPAEQSIEEKFLLSNDPTVVFDDNCIREYRLTLLWNITFPYRSNHLLAGGDGSRFTMALFVQHGALRDAADYFCSFMRLMRQQPYRPFEEILIIAPHFQYRHDDYLHPRDAFWNTSKPWGDWYVCGACLWMFYRATR